jgi:hypothetical protein
MLTSDWGETLTKMRNLRNTSLCVLLLVTSILFSCEKSTGVRDTNRPRSPTIKNEHSQHLESLERISMWFIEKGIAQYYATRNNSHVLEFVRSNGGFLYGRFPSKDERYVPWLVSQIDDIRADVRRWAFSSEDGFQYEYWVMKIFALSEPHPRDIQFILTKSRDNSSERSIIESHDHFVAGFSISNGKILKFPTDLKSLYAFQSWKYPDAFKGTELEGVEVIWEPGSEPRLKE